MTIFSHVTVAALCRPLKLKDSQAHVARWKVWELLGNPKLHQGSGGG